MSPLAAPFDLLYQFAFFYPLTMSFVWMIGGLYFFLRRERETRRHDDPPPAKAYPFVSILVPCYNERDTVEETVVALEEQSYPDFEIIAINDGSRDDTAEKLDSLLERCPRLRVVHLNRNQGKASALRMGALAARSEYLVCVDADALLDEHATRWLVWHLVDGPRVGAVTGNPRIRNRSTLLGRLQVGEFSAVLGMIKRAQRVYGRIFTVSGVICAFRRTALHRIGYWHDDVLTEDIDVSWRLQLDHWDIRFEPNALGSILMPETFAGLWRQRLRWAQGGVEVLLRHTRSMLHWRQRRMWGVLVELALSTTWSYVTFGILCLWTIGWVVPLPPPLRVASVLPHWHGLVLAVVCLMQFAVGMILDRRYEKRFGGHYYWMIWYPAAFWLLNLGTTVTALPKTLLRRGRQRVVWSGSDRGIR